MASRGINKVILIGHLGQNPDVRTTPTGTTVANLSLATSETWKDQAGNRQERTEWHRIVLYGRQAEIAHDYLRKGSHLYLEGRLQTRKWQDKTAQDRYTTEIIGQEFQMLDRPDHDRAPGPAPSAPPGPAPAAPYDDEIPF